MPFQMLCLIKKGVNGFSINTKLYRAAFLRENRRLFRLWNDENSLYNTRWELIPNNMISRMEV